MADSISYTPTTWADGADGGTPITAARLNNIEQGVSAATKQANANADSIKTLGDSVSQMARRSHTDWSTSVRLDRASALLVFNGGNCIYGLWEPMGTPTLVKIHGDYDIAGISVTESGSALVVSWTESATCIALY